MTRILLVEDNSSDAMLLQEALRAADVTFPVDHVTDGEQAMAHLRSAEPAPGLVLLDLNLPRMDGREVLQALKEDDELRRIPVVVLTTSESEEDVLRSYTLHANAYVTKPVDFDRFIDVVRQIDDFFVSVVRLPGR